MNLPSFMSLEILVIAISAGLTLALVYGYYQLSQRLQQAHRVINGLQCDVSALCTGAVGISRHLDKIEDQSRYLADRQDQINVSAGGDRPYIQAMRMAERGVDIEELMATCDLAKEEAALIRAMYANADESKPNANLDVQL